MKNFAAVQGVAEALDKTIENEIDRKTNVNLFVSYKDKSCNRRNYIFDDLHFQPDSKGIVN